MVNLDNGHFITPWFLKIYLKDLQKLLMESFINNFLKYELRIKSVGSKIVFATKCLNCIQQGKIKQYVHYNKINKKFSYVL